ncbi:unnamed protein product [Ectocarpus sp. 4 AP-2014]
MAHRWGLACAAGLLLAALGKTDAFYLPGKAPNSFSNGEKVELQVVLLTSTKTQIPFDYYRAPYCRPSKITKEAENLGEVLMGDKISSSPYVLEMAQNAYCSVLCHQQMSDGDMKQLRSLIGNDYRVHMQLDNLPVAIVRDDRGQTTTHGFPVGYQEGGDHFLYNHLTFIVKYHEADHFQGKRVVGFEVIPYSIAHRWEETHMEGGGQQEPQSGDAVEGNRRRDRQLGENLETCPERGMAPPIDRQSVEAAGEVIFTYDVEWELDAKTTWSRRWENYLKGNPENEIHYFSIVNSLMITLFLTGVVAMIMLRTLRKDITNYNEMQSVEDAQEESGWKLVHGDVFRPPSFSPMLLSIMCGTGMQVLAMTLSTITFAFLGFLSPANRGGMLTALLVLFVLMGSFAGYWSATMYKFFNGKMWKRCTLATALLFPSMIFAIFAALDIMVWSRGSSSKLPVSLLFLWFFVCAPLVFVGSYFGFRAETYTIPVRVNQIARHVPGQLWYTNPMFAIALGGVLPFGAVCIELFFIMSALWLHQIYYVFGFLYVVFFILIATCGEITMVMCYFQLCNEDYHWWWRAFLSAGSSAGYLFMYSAWYFYSKLDISGFVSTSVYFGYMLVIALTFFLLTGSSGFFACFWFVRKIYSAIKVD